MRVIMSGKGVAFRIDVILQSVNELRQEKQTLEQRYAEEKCRSKNLEMKLEQETVKFCQSRDRNSKMQETVKLAQQKVRQTDSQADRLNEINDSKQKVIADLNEKINQESVKQENDVTEFQVKLSELTQFFRDAKKAYAKDNLMKETKEWKENMDSAINEAQTKNVELEDVTKAFQNLSVDTNKIKELVVEKVGHGELTYKELKAAIDQLTRKQEQLHKFLKWLDSCEKIAKSEIQEYDKRRLITGQERRSRMVETEIADVIVRDIPPAQITQRFDNGEHLSRNQHRDPSYDPNYSNIQPNHQHVPKQSTTPITYATSGHFPEHANNVVDQGPRHHSAPNQNIEPVTHAVPIHISERANNVVDQGPRHHSAPNQNIEPVTHAVPIHISERANNVNQESRIHHTALQNTPAVTRATTGHVPAVNSPSFFISLPFGRTR